MFKNIFMKRLFLSLQKGGHFVNIGIGYAFTKSFGVFFPYIREEFEVDNTTTSLIFSIMMFTQYCGSLIGTDHKNRKHEILVFILSNNSL